MIITKCYCDTCGKETKEEKLSTLMFTWKGVYERYIHVCDQCEFDTGLTRKEGSNWNAPGNDWFCEIFKNLMKK